MKLAEEYQEAVFRKYTEMVLDDAENQPNLAYSSSTHDLWERTT